MLRKLFTTNLSTTGHEVSRDEISGGLTTSRLEAFSDGVFAIAITILVLSIQVPNLSGIHSPEDFSRQVGELWPKFLTYFISFVVVGIYWVAHSATFHYIRRTNRPLFWLNLLYLMGVSFIPFPTALLGSFYQYQLSIVIYAGTQVVTGGLFEIMVLYATYNGLSNGPIDPNFIQRASFRNLMGPALYLVAIVVSYISIEVSLVLLVVVLALYILPGKIDRDWRRLPLAHPHPAPDLNSNPTEETVNVAQAARSGKLAKIDVFLPKDVNKK